MTDNSRDIHLLWNSFWIQSLSTYAHRGEEASTVGGHSWRTRRSKRGDHGLANSAYGEKMHSRNLEDVRAKTLVADISNNHLMP